MDLFEKNLYFLQKKKTNLENSLHKEIIVPSWYSRIQSFAHNLSL